MTGARLVCPVCWLALAALAGGCQGPVVPAPQVDRPGVRTSPCADRLHDICGELLLYYAAHGALPPTLDELCPAAGPEAASRVCPASGKPYVYDPAGLTAPGRAGRLVLYDPDPSHAGMRWGAFLDAGGPAKTPAMRVILLSEGAFRAAMKRP